MKKRLGMAVFLLALLGGGAAGVNWGMRRLMTVIEQEAGKEIPTTTVRRGEVTIEVTARGELQGGNSEVLIAPQAGSPELPVVFLRGTGEFVNAGDIVAQFDPTQQEYNMKEAEADLAEAQQKVAQAEAEAAAALEEARFATVQAAANLKLAEVEVRKNPTLAATLARQNDLALEAARNRKDQADRDYANRQKATNSNIAIQKAAANRSQLLMDNAKRNIEAMVLRAKTSGFVQLQNNTAGVSIAFAGMVLPTFQVGDIARAGQIIATIPDMSTWELSASVPEVDRGYITVGQKVEVKPVALAGRGLKGHVKLLGGTTGTASNRRFETRVALDEAHPDLRPGMSANAVITVETLKDVLWIPAQALFESDGRTFVYARSGQDPAGMNFVQRDVKLMRRSESQAVITGIDEGQVVALSAPDAQDAPSKGGAKDGKDGVMKALTK